MSSNNKKQKTESPEQVKKAEEKDLENFLFGNTDGSLWDKTGKELQDDNDSSEEESDNNEVQETDEQALKGELFFFDSGPGFVAEANESTPMASDAEDSSKSEKEYDSGDSESDDEEEQNDYGQKPAWEDDDDARLQISLQGLNRLKKLRKTEDEDLVSGIEYERRLRKQFSKIYPRPAWATLPSESRKRKASGNVSDDSDVEYPSDDEKMDDQDRIDLLKSTYGILEKRGTSQILSPRFLDIMRLKNANQMSPCNASITSVQFHPNAQVMLTASKDKTLKLFQIDGKINPKIQSIYFKDTPIRTAAFHPSGDQIVVSGRRKHYYIYDVQSGTVDKCPGIWGRDEKSLEKFSISPCGRYIAFLGTSGTIILVSFLTKQWMANLKMNGTVDSVDWSADGKYIFGIGKEGEVYQFDIGQRMCVKRWFDDGQIKATDIRVSPNENFYATGSGSGIVNVYDRSALDPSVLKPKPIKAIGNLTTEITGIKFNHDSQLMAIASGKKA
ncbi:WD40-repeat-containing domain protein, partial [Phycomyces nitens]